MVAFLGGTAWSSWFGEQTQESRVSDKEQMVLAGSIEGIPYEKYGTWRFYFRPLYRILEAGPEHGIDGCLAADKTPAYLAPGTCVSDRNLPQGLRVRWHQSHGSVPTQMLPGDIWQFSLQVKPVSNRANPGAHDAEGQAFTEGVSGLASVDHRITARKLKEGDGGFDQLRQRFRAHLLALTENHEMQGSNIALVLALVIGDRSLLDSHHWRLLAETGTAHLMAISGLHISIIAGFVWFLVYHGWCLSTRLTSIMPCHLSGGIARRDGCFFL